MKKLLLASKNEHKLEEFKKILSPFDIDLLSLKDLNDNDEVIEDGLTFYDNAYIKAKYYYDKYHIDTISDDSGITIEYFNNLPDIHSARFLKHLDYPAKNQLICQIMNGVKNRHAYYTCAIVICSDKGCFDFTSEWHGKISDEPKGNNGFGYDPIFYLDEYQMTSGELKPDIKNAISHRALALKKVVKYFEEN